LVEITVGFLLVGRKYIQFVGRKCTTIKITVGFLLVGRKCIQFVPTFEICTAGESISKIICWEY
jgi:hypothetical protein